MGPSAEDLRARELLQTYKTFFREEADGKVTCLCNGHSFPMRFDVLDAFIHGRKFPTLAKRYQAEQKLDQYEPFIVQSKNFPNMLYCSVTGQLIDKSIAAVKLHMAGQKYKYKKALHDKEQRPLKPEPSVDDILGVALSTRKRTKDEVEEGEADEEEEVDLEADMAALMEHGDDDHHQKGNKLQTRKIGETAILLEEALTEDDAASSSESDLDAGVSQPSDDAFEFEDANRHLEETIAGQGTTSKKTRTPPEKVPKKAAAKRAGKKASTAPPPTKKPRIAGDSSSRLAGKPAAMQKPNPDVKPSSKAASKAAAVAGVVSRTGAPKHAKSPKLKSKR